MITTTAQTLKEPERPSLSCPLTTVREPADIARTLQGLCQGRCGGDITGLGSGGLDSGSCLVWTQAQVTHRALIRLTVEP